MDLHAELKKQEGQTLTTLSHGKAFAVLAVTKRGVLVHPAGSKERQVTWRQLDPAWSHLQRRGKLTQVEVRDQYSKISSGHVLALLATLPGVAAGKEKTRAGQRLTPTLYTGGKAPAAPPAVKKEVAPRPQSDGLEWAVWMKK